MLLRGSISSSNLVQAILPSGAIVERPAPASIEDVIRGTELEGSLAVKLNGELTSLRAVVASGTIHLQGVTLASPEGVLVYRKSLCFLLFMAMQEISPGANFLVRNSLGNGYFLIVEGLEEIPQGAIDSLNNKVTEIVNNNWIISKTVIHHADAQKYFQSTGRHQTADLLKTRTDPTLEVYRCGEFMDTSRYALASRTGLLKIVSIFKYRNGVFLRYPLQNGEIGPFIDDALVMDVCTDRRKTAQAIGVVSVSEMNEKILQGRAKHMIQLCEAVHDREFTHLADRIYALKEQIKLILIAGPSSSCKTTFAHRLNTGLQSYGLHPVTISVDDYYNPPEKCPKDAQGNCDYERIEALNVELLNENLLGLFAGEAVEIPHYDFVTHRPKEKGHIMSLPRNGILIMEGIHCLNDELTNRVPRTAKFKIAVSPVPAVNLDNATHISNANIRLIRRLVRDYLTRGHSALKTLRMWPAVRYGEVAYIYPHQPTADAFFNTSVAYELAVLKVFVEPLLRAIPLDTPEYDQARRTLRFLDDILPMPAKFVPPQSLLLEFIGGSWYYS